MDEILSEDEYLKRLRYIITLQERRQQMIDIGEQIEKKIAKIDIEIEAVEHAIERALAVIEKEDLVQSVINLKQQRKKLVHKQQPQ